MLKTLFFTFVVHLVCGWWYLPAPWVQQGKSQERKAAVMIPQSPPVAPEAFFACENRPDFPGPLWKKAAAAHGVDPMLLYSVALFESGRGDQKRAGPWPYAMHFNDANVSVYAISAKEARFVLAHVYTDNIDIGLCQVNYKSHKDKVNRPEDLLDVRTNMEVASQILAEAIKSTPDPELGIGRYHSWTEWRARAYGKKILTIYQVLKNAVNQPRG